MYQNRIADGLLASLASDRTRVLLQHSLPCLDSWYRLLPSPWLTALAVPGARDTLALAGDVEAPTPDRSGPPYERRRALGFTVGYHRSHYVKELG